MKSQDIMNSRSQDIVDGPVGCWLRAWTRTRCQRTFGGRSRTGRRMLSEAGSSRFCERHGISRSVFYKIRRQAPDQDPAGASPQSGQYRHTNDQKERAGQGTQLHVLRRDRSGRTERARHLERDDRRDLHQRRRAHRLLPAPRRDRHVLRATYPDRHAHEGRRTQPRRRRHRCRRADRIQGWLRPGSWPRSSTPATNAGANRSPSPGTPPP